MTIHVSPGLPSPAGDRRRRILRFYKGAKLLPPSSFLIQTISQYSFNPEGLKRSEI